jgi:two-component system, NarL family, response regulator NreC
MSAFTEGVEPVGHTQPLGSRTATTPQVGRPRRSVGGVISPPFPADPRNEARRAGQRLAHTARVAIADDHHLVRAGVRHSLARVTRPHYDVVAEAADPSRMVAAVARVKPDLLILEIVMGERSVLDALTQCLGLRPELAVVVLTSTRDPHLARDAIGAGALGYVLKDAEPGELLVALQLALRGASYLAPGLATRLADDRDRDQLRALTAREREVVRLVALGHTFPEIAATMHFSERTLKNDRARAAEILGISTRVEFTRWALQHGLLSARQAA